MGTGIVDGESFTLNFVSMEQPIEDALFHMEIASPVYAVLLFSRFAL